MGYTTEFEGQFKLDKPLEPAQIAYLNKFSETRRMRRDNLFLQNNIIFPDPIREAAGLALGIEGGYFVGGGGWTGQDHDRSIIEYNDPPTGQPGLWCQWVPNTDGTAIEWNGTEKFYNYTAWLEYIIQHFIAPWGYVLNGEVDWQGEETDDVGTIVVNNNVVSIEYEKDDNVDLDQDELEQDEIDTLKEALESSLSKFGFPTLFPALKMLSRDDLLRLQSVVQLAVNSK